MVARLRLVPSVRAVVAVREFPAAAEFREDFAPAAFAPDVFLASLIGGFDVFDDRREFDPTIGGDRLRGSTDRGHDRRANDDGEHVLTRAIMMLEGRTGTTRRQAVLDGDSIDVPQLVVAGIPDVDVAIPSEGELIASSCARERLSASSMSRCFRFRFSIPFSVLRGFADMLSEPSQDSPARLLWTGGRASTVSVKHAHGRGSISTYCYETDDHKATGMPQGNRLTCHASVS